MVSNLSSLTSNRRALIGGAAGAVVAATGIAIGINQFGGDDPEQVIAAQPTPRTPAAETPAPDATATAAQPTATTAQSNGVRASRALLAVPDGMALVTSPRLPLFGVGSAEMTDLLAGKLPSWLDAGSPIDLEVAPLALESVVPEGAVPVETLKDYEALVKELARRPGGVALIPLDQVDFRVNVLAVDGVDPLRDIPNDADPLLRIGVVGDIVPGRNVGAKMRAYGDYTYPFRRVAAELSRFDLTIANLEGNLSPNIQPPEDAHTFSFVASPEMVEGLKLAGIDAVSVANNHSRWNSEGWGESAFLDTIDALAAGGVPHFGGGRNLVEARTPWVANPNGRTVAILGIDGVTANEQARELDATVNESWFGASQYAGATDSSSGTNPYFIDQVLGDIGQAASQYDIVIPYFHFGQEYIGIPPQWAVDGARAAISAGAAAVVTNHPHVIQGMEVFEGKPIVYSVGNFIFDQMFSVDTRSGLILELAFRGSKVVGLRTKGVEIEDFCQPRLMTAGEQAGIMDRFWWSTDRIAESR